MPRACATQLASDVNGKWQIQMYTRRIRLVSFNSNTGKSLIHVVFNPLFILAITLSNFYARKVSQFVLKIKLGLNNGLYVSVAKL
jgi:hypothetical protein